MNRIRDGTKFLTMSEYVDIETGEIISKSLAEREYLKIRVTKKTENNGKYCITKRTTECRHNGQQKLFD